MPELTGLPRDWRAAGRMALAGAALAGLVGCAAPLEPPAYRMPGDPIYSNASFDVARLQGAWRQVAGFDAGPGCSGGTANFTKDGAGAMAGAARLCAAGRMQEWSGPVTRIGPGRFTIGGGAPWWVLWDEADNRTLVIGTPSGAFGFVLDRETRLPADRLAAAREILAFNGYDIARLRLD